MAQPLSLHSVTGEAHRRSPCPTVKRLCTSTKTQEKPTGEVPAPQWRGYAPQQRLRRSPQEKSMPHSEESVHLNKDPGEAHRRSPCPTVKRLCTSTKTQEKPTREVPAPQWRGYAPQQRPRRSPQEKSMPHSEEAMHLNKDPRELSLKKRKLGIMK